MRLLTAWWACSLALRNEGTDSLRSELCRRSWPGCGDRVPGRRISPEFGEGGEVSGDTGAVDLEAMLHFQPGREVLGARPSLVQRDEFGAVLLELRLPVLPAFLKCATFLNCGELLHGVKL